MPNCHNNEISDRDERESNLKIGMIRIFKIQIQTLKKSNDLRI